MMKNIIPVILIVLLSGCSTQLINRGAEANDSAVNASFFTLCRGASIGSILRKFDTEEKAETWMSLCMPGSKFTIVEQ